MIFSITYSCPPFLPLLPFFNPIPWGSLSVLNNKIISIRRQTSHHNQHPINRQRKTHPSQRRKSLRVKSQPLPIIQIIILLIQLLMIRIRRARNLVVEKPRKDERNSSRSRSTNIRQDCVQRIDAHGDEVGKDDDDSGNDSKFQIPNNLDWASVSVQWSIPGRSVKQWSRTVRARTPSTTLKEPCRTEL